METVQSTNPGYAGEILRVNLSTGEVKTVPTKLYSDRFLGGRGIAAKIHWDEVAPEIDAFDPENRLVFMTGPVCGVPGFAGSRWQISGKSPQTNLFSYGNLGGAWGAQLKFAGYDGLVIHGKAEGLSYIVIEDNNVEIKDGSFLKTKGTIDTREILKNKLGKSFRIASIGVAGENRVNFATLLADSDSSCSAGFGAVMGSKNLKAIAVRGRKKVQIAKPDMASKLRKKVRSIKAPAISFPSSLPEERFSKDVCFGCIDGCIRNTYKAKDGKVGKFICQSALFYETRAQLFYGEATEAPFYANKLCDDLGLDTRAVETMIMWLSRCHKSGIISEEKTGLPLSKIGSIEFIEALLENIAKRQGFGDILARGTMEAAKVVGKDSSKLITDYMIETGENAVYGARLYITTGMFYAMEPRMPIQHLHEISIPAVIWGFNRMGWQDNYMTSEVIRKIAEKFWGGKIAADFSTYEGKAMAAARIQDREYAKESMILCDFSWPINHTPFTEDYTGDPTLESQICSVVTGRDIDEKGLYKLGERVFNLQRAILSIEGKKGREHDVLGEFNFEVPLKGDFGNPDCIVPGPDGEIFPRKGMVLEKDGFEKMKDEFYEVRGWDVPTGLQTREKLEELDLGDISQKLWSKGLVV
jgi:aldehyde:ferredoxin oxidoreductase